MHNNKFSPITCELELFKYQPWCFYQVFRATQYDNLTKDFYTAPLCSKILKCFSWWKTENRGNEKHWQRGFSADTASLANGELLVITREYMGSSLYLIFLIKPSYPSHNSILKMHCPTVFYIQWLFGNTQYGQDLLFMSFGAEKFLLLEF